jgi:hypothetical protein
MRKKEGTCPRYIQAKALIEAYGIRFVPNGLASLKAMLFRWPRGSDIQLQEGFIT